MGSECKLIFEVHVDGTDNCCWPVSVVLYFLGIDLVPRESNIIQYVRATLEVTFK